MRSQHRRVLVGEVRGDAGEAVAARLRSSEAYTFSVETACAIVERIRHGEFSPGFQTPASVYGPSLVLDNPSVQLEEIAPSAEGS